MGRGPLDLDHPMLRPLWRRLALVALCLGWAGLEIARGAYLWAGLFGAMGLWAAWELLIAYEEKDEDHE